MKKIFFKLILGLVLLIISLFLKNDKQIEFLVQSILTLTFFTELLKCIFKYLYNSNKKLFKKIFFYVFLLGLISIFTILCIIGYKENINTIIFFKFILCVIIVLFGFLYIICFIKNYIEKKSCINSLKPNIEFYINFLIVFLIFITIVNLYLLEKLSIENFSKYSISIVLLYINYFLEDL